MCQVLSLKHQNASKLASFDELTWRRLPFFGIFVYCHQTLNDEENKWTTRKDIQDRAFNHTKFLAS